MSENVANKNLTPRQYKAISSLLSGTSKQRAAKDCGVTVRTIERWMIDLAFNHPRRQPTIDLVQGWPAVGPVTRSGSQSVSRPELSRSITKCQEKNGVTKITKS